MIRVIPVSDEFRDAVLSNPRRVNIYMHVGVGVDNTSADDISSTGGGSLPMSSPAQVVDAKYSLTPNLATYEGDGIPTALSERTRVPPLEPTDGPLEVGIWSDAISDADGYIDWTLSLTFNTAHESALTVYTSEVHILESEVVFSLGGEETHRGTYTPTDDRMQVPGVYAYDSISIRVLRLDQPYHHVRITEIEFGASLTLSRSTVTGTVEYVAETDPTGTTVPLNELTFGVVNRGHVYDFDAPGREREMIRVGAPIMLSFQVSTPSGMQTAPCGRFYIRTIDAGNGEAVVTANDPRVVLTDVYRAWSVPTSESIGDAVDRVCGEVHLAHTCDDALYSMHPPRTLEFPEDTSYMEDLSDMLQLMGAEVVPGHDGALVFRPYADPQDYGAVGKGLMYSYPLKQTNIRSYNLIAVRWEGGTYELDLRSDSASQAVAQITVNNPLIVTEDEARAVAEHIRANLHNEELETEWRGDPSLEVGDLVGFPGRFSEAVPRRVVMQSIRFDGGMSARTTTVL